MVFMTLVLIPGLLSAVLLRCHVDAQCSELAGGQGAPNGFAERTYSESLEHLENPGRGFANLLETHASSHVALTTRQLASLRETTGITMVWRTYSLDTFKTSSISTDFLNKIRHDLDVVVQSSFNIVLRFGYIFELNPEPPYGDASKNIVLQHIEQLRPIFRDYEGVITSIQAGFIGAWGEWHSTDYFGNPEWDTPGHDPVTGLMPEALRDRKDVVLALLRAAPTSIQVQLRTPSQKRSMMGTATSSFAGVQAGEDNSRTGHHNDCFLASDTDYGTYVDKSIEYPYLETDTRYVIMGGETCGTTTNHRHECPTALREMQMFHWTYLNNAYNPDVLDTWKRQRCYDEVHRRLGYRLLLKKAILPDTVQAGDSLCFSLEFTNTGFAAPVKNLNVSIVLKSSSNTYYAAHISDVDVRDWQPAYSSFVTSTAQVERNIPVGTYQVLVALGDRLMGHQADYNILLANTGVPLYAEGLNDLGHTITITAAHGSPMDCTNCAHFSSWQPPTRSQFSRVFRGSFT